MGLDEKQNIFSPQYEQQCFDIACVTPIVAKCNADMLV